MYTHGMKTTIRKWGNSLAIRIPKAFAIHLGLDSGEAVELSMEKNGLHITPSRPTLDEIMEATTPDMLHEYIDTGPPRGREIW